jgi:hypothetical protein
MSDYNEELSELHRQVVKDELGLLATIDENYLEFEDPDLGTVTINLRDYNPEYMRIAGVVFEDFKDTYARDDLVRNCNTVNCSLDCSQELARLTVMDNRNVVRASVVLVLAAEGNMPDEDLLSGDCPLYVFYVFYQGCGKRIHG